jgi:hypothetical protein
MAEVVSNRKGRKRSIHFISSSGTMKNLEPSYLYIGCREITVIMANWGFGQINLIISYPCDQICSNWQSLQLVIWYNKHSNDFIAMFMQWWQQKTSDWVPLQLLTRLQAIARVALHCISPIVAIQLQALHDIALHVLWPLLYSHFVFLANIAERANKYRMMANDNRTRKIMPKTNAKITSRL